MAQELTVALRIKAFLTEARQAVKQFRQDLKEVGDTADQSGAKLAAASGRFFNAAELQNVTEAWKRYRASALPPLKETDDLLKKSTLSVKQHAMAMRQLPMQITDIVTSLASGMPPYMVFIQQGGQLRDSFQGSGNALRALTSLITPFRLAVGAAAAAVATLVLAYKQGSEEDDKFARSLVMSGNAAGATTDDLREMAQALDDVIGTQSDAADALAQMAGSGEVARRDLQQFTQTALEWERATGQAVSETVKAFTELGKKPVEATLKLNESMHFMTAALYDQLQALVRNGREQEAAEVAQQAYDRALRDRTATLESRLGILQRAWRSVRDVAKEAWDAMLDIGRADTLEKKIEDQRALVAFLEQEVARQPNRADTRQRLGAAQGALFRLEDQKLQQDALAQTAGEAAKVTEEFIKARQANQRYADAALSKQEQLNRKLAEYRRNNEKIRAGGGVITDAEVKAQERAIYEEVFGKSAVFDTAKAKAALERARLQADLQLLQASVKEGDAIIVQAVQDGNLSIAAAYNARLSQITTEGEAQRRTLQAEAAEIDKALRSAKTESERAPLQQQKVEVQARLKLLDSSLSESARQLTSWKQDQERQLATITARVRLDVAGLTGTFDREAVQQQLQETLRGSREAAGRIDDPGEAAAMRARLDLIQSAGVAQAEFNAKLGEAQRLTQQLAITEGALQVQAQQGTISQTELKGRLRAARAAQVPALQAILQQLIAIRGAMPPEAAAAIDSMNASIGELQNQAAAATPVVTDLGTRLRNTAIDGLADAAAQAVTNFRDLRSSVASLLKQIAGDIVRSGIKQALLDQFSTSSSGSSGPGWGSVIISAAKSFFGFADGGLIRGPGTGTSDSIPGLVDGRRPVRLSDEEFIQPKRAVKHYGLGFMEAIRTLRLPKPGYAFGGLVAAHERARFATGGLVTAGAGAQPANIKIEMVNNGTPQRITGQQQQFDGKQLVVRVMLDDMARNGPISQAMGRRGG